MVFVKDAGCGYREGVMGRLLVVCFFMALCSCGALKKTKQIDRVRQSASLSVNTSVRSEENVKVEDKSVRERKSSEKSSDDVVTETEIYFDSAGNVSYVRQRKTESRQNEKQEEGRDSLDYKGEFGKNEEIDTEAEYKSKTDSLKKNLHLEQPENKVWSFIGAGILLVFAAVAVVIYVRLKR